jgi:hypothetical protein
MEVVTMNYNKFKNVGKIQFNNGYVDITDPCYDMDTWCRMNHKAIKQGIYNCFIKTGHPISDEGRIAGIAILHESNGDKWPTCGLKWEHYGIIGVDAGLAGFFEDKPDYEDKNWSAFCNFIYAKPRQSFFIVNSNSPCHVNGFFSDSGYGDGEYCVEKHMGNDGEIDGLRIYFID